MRILPLLVILVALVVNPLYSRAELLVKPGESIAVMGDSITQWGFDYDGGYVRLVAEGLADQGVNITVIPAGRIGNTSRQMLGRLQSDVIDKRPTWMTLSAGVNDVNNAVELPEYKTNITAMLDHCQAAGIKVIVLTATQINLPVTNAQNTKLAGYNDFLRETAKARNLPLADVNAAMVEEQAVYAAANAERVLTTDGVHMNIYGNMVIAKRVLATFGLNSTQLAAAQNKWNQRPDVYPLPNGPAPRGNGTGLTGQYFSDLNFTNLVQTQIDVQLYNFQWGLGSPRNVDGTRMAGMPADNFSVRWTGQLQALDEGVYTISVNANDTAKVWIGDLTGTPLINQASPGDGYGVHGAFFMKAGQKYNIKIEYTELTGDTDIQLHWRRPSFPGSIVQKTQLYPTTVAPPATPSL